MTYAGHLGQPHWAVVNIYHLHERFQEEGWSVYYEEQIRECGTI